MTTHPRATKRKRNHISAKAQSNQSVNDKIDVYDKDMSSVLPCHRILYGKELQVLCMLEFQRSI